MIGALLGALMINLLQQSLLRWRVISNFWVDALLGMLILVAVTIDAVIINRLRDIWSRRGLESDVIDEKKLMQEEESHVA
jgi:rhamnose transport system permease protein